MTALRTQLMCPSMTRFYDDISSKGPGLVLNEHRSRAGCYSLEFGILESFYRDPGKIWMRF